MEGAKTVSVGAVYVPNSFLIGLGPEDFERFEGLFPTLREEFAGLLRRSAADRRWQLPGPLVVAFRKDDTVAPGQFAVHAEHDADAVAPEQEPGPRNVIRLTGSVPPKQWDLQSGRLTVGRLPACDVSLNDPNASRQHAELVERDDGWWIVDLDSTNGTFVNGSLVKERRLASGDRIQIGSSRLEYATEESKRVPQRDSGPEGGQGVPAPTQVVSNPLNAD